MSKKPEATVETLRIARLAHKGDGVAETDAGQIFVPYTLEGELVSAQVQGTRAELNEIIEPSAHRVASVCKHFSTCGGCSLQHMDEASYKNFKRQQVIDALASRGIETPVEDVVVCGKGSRRRAVFAAVKAGHKVLFGYHTAKSNRLVDIEECPVIAPELMKAVPGLRKLAGEILPRKGELKFTVTTTQSGLDVAIGGLGKNKDKHYLELSQGAVENDFARLTVDGETIIEIRPPLLDMSGVAVPIPSGGFIQAAMSAEKTMGDLLSEGLSGCKRVADLFCGAGTLTFNIGQFANAHAVEGEATSLKALDLGLRRAKGLKKVTTERRDLFRRPIVAKELDNFGKGFDGVVFDPPRAGALAQAQELAKSPVKKIVAVSCSPASFARDIRELLEGGYQIKRVVPIDQFLYSPHVEVVALLERGA
ncbi:class I SAM-dependent RNA methyltransferase [Pseudovibrio sp. Ad37]|uniref:class I SAM-dependent RNA methyltransferase n=1 Tax=Pseudovibrio sp. Ad37 TaxID=989422 RepID=UPI0007AE9127|nr:class I SAM-dependent RNA methyltransferase [Pseudovibrio sp. Ad37]KZL27351.1 23S rRNA (uracil(1939)-C(5))-methyltransferase RlmD [Pseudovibrio sp. Ad37]